VQFFSKIALGFMLTASMVGVSAGCSSKAGDSCTKGTASCLNDKAQLTCQVDKFIESPCAGPKGCRTEADKVLCDVSGNKAGDACSTDDEGNGACTADGKSMVSCEKGKYTVTQCLGAAGCKDTGSGFTCDRSVATDGEPCSKDGTSACSVDGTVMLVCKDGKLGKSRECRGAKKCDAAGDKVVCDSSLAMVGDPCEAGGACSVDGKQLLECKDGKMALGSECSGDGGCKVDGDKINCAQGAAPAAE
jgi:hypothetical protein